MLLFMPILLAVKVVLIGIGIGIGKVKCFNPPCQTSLVLQAGVGGPIVSMGVQVNFFISQFCHFSPVSVAAFNL